MFTHLEGAKITLMLDFISAFLLPHPETKLGNMEGY